MSYLIYGKRPQDKTFRALSYKGVRVTKLVDAKRYATKEDAEAVLAKVKPKEKLKNVFEIRRAK